MHMKSSRPIRSRQQPLYTKDQVQLNSSEIQKLQNNKAKNSKAQTYPSYAKILLSFVSQVNQSYRDHCRNPQKEKMLNFGENSLEKIESKKSKQNCKLDQRRKDLGVEKKRKSLREEQEASVRERKKTDKKTKYIKKEKVPQKEKINTIKPLANSTKTLEEVPKTENSRKAFSRASYHIGIAYRIYLDQIKEKIPLAVDRQTLDPTYLSQKIRFELMRTQ